MAAREYVGELDRYVDIEVNTPVADADDNSEQDSWAVGFSVWANRQRKSGSVVREGNQEQSETVEVYTVRYDARISVANRLTEDGKSYEIHSVEGLGRRQYMELEVRRVE